MSIRVKGFTLLEILVTIGIIGVLTTVGILATQSIRLKARDANRVSDIQQVVGALEQYYLRNSYYPTMITVGQAIAVGDRTYLDQAPNNAVPRTDGDCFDKEFYYETTSTGYQLTFCLGSDTGSLKKGINVCTNGNCEAGNGLKVEDSDGNIYTGVAIGGQLWLDSNLKVGTTVNGAGNQADADGTVIQRYCYENNPANCSTFGGLYQWHTAMAFPQSCDTSNSGCTVGTFHRGICPEGWHVPTDADWHELELYYAVPANDENCDLAHDNGDCSPAGQPLKSAALWNGQEGTNTSGFSGLPSGYRDGGDNQFYCSGDDECDTSLFWTASIYSDMLAYQHNLYLEDHGVYRGNYAKLAGLGLRCIKNY